MTEFDERANMLEADEPLLHWCEVCGRETYLTPATAFETGWDFPPTIGAFGVVTSPTCPDCRISETAGWALTMRSIPVNELDARHRATIDRILRERLCIG